MDLQLFSQEKREAPTSRRRQEARRKGQVFRSNELSAALSILVIYAVLRLNGPRMVDGLGRLAVHYWTGLVAADDFLQVQGMYVWSLGQIGGMMWPVALAVMITGLTAGLGQVGLNLNLSLLSPKFARLNPISGVQRLFSRRTLMEGAKAVAKVVIIAMVVWMVVRGRMETWPRLAAYPPTQAATLVLEAVNALLVSAGLCLLVLGMIDYAYQWWEHEQSLRMTRQELKDEMKEVEGRPELRAAQRSRQRQLARSRMMAAVATADVVVTNPTHVAVALRYAVERPAPEVVAKGQEHMARRILEVARQHQIAIVSRPDLARALYRAVEVGAFIPAELYQAVAEVLAFVYRVNSRGEDAGR